MKIGDLSEEKFKGVFKIANQGDAFLVIQTIVQVLYIIFKFNNND